MNLFTKTLMRMVGLKPDMQKQVISREELRSIVSEAGEATPDEQHPQMLLSILDMETVTVDDIMVPRNEIAGIDIDDDWKAIMRQLNHAPHNRIVLYKGSLDEQVLGILRVREAFRLLLEKNEFTKETLLRAVDEVYFIPEGTNLRDLNKMFGWELDTEDARTFNGLILEHLEDIPDEGTVCEIDGLKITILEVSDNMIKQAKVEKLAA